MTDFDFYIKNYKLSLFLLYQCCFALCPESWQPVKFNCSLQKTFRKFNVSIRVYKTNNSYTKIKYSKRMYSQN